MSLKMLLNKPIQFYVAFVFLLLLIFYNPSQRSYSNKKTKEGFLTWGNYPRDTTYTLLYEDYQLKKKNYSQVSSNNYSDNYEYYPIFSSDSSKINNLRYWTVPDNGKCSTAEFCNVLYENKDIPETKIYPPQPEWSPKRVNYYETGLYA